MKNFIKILILLFILYSSTNSYSKTIRVAVLDTGFDFNSKWGKKNPKGKVFNRPKICKKGHKDLTNTEIQDRHGHGTHVAGIIGMHAGKADYCLVIIKTYSYVSNPEIITKAIEYAITQNVDIINYSGGGFEFSLIEYITVKKALKKGIVFVAAAGNLRLLIDYGILKASKIITKYINHKTSHVTVEMQNGYFPATYDRRMISVGNITKNGKLQYDTNYGAAVTHYEIGMNVWSILPNERYGTMSGTSQSAAVKTGKIIKKWYK